MTKLYTWLQARTANEEGVTVLEYGLTAALVSIVLAGILVTTGTNIMGFVEDAVDAAIG